MRIRLLASWCALLLVGLAALGCKGFFTDVNTTPGTIRFVYVLNQNPSGIGSISGYLADASTGALATLTNSPTGVGTLTSLPNSMSSDAAGKFLFVSSQNVPAPGGGVNGFLINGTTGALASVGATTATAAGATPAALFVDPAARAVYVLEPGSPSKVEGFAINSSTGALSALTGSPFSLGNVNATSLAEDPSGRFLFVGANVSGGTGQILTVPINSDATLNVTTPIASVNTPTPVVSLAVTPSARFVFAADGVQGVSAFSVSSTSGALTLVGSSPFTTAGMLAPVSVAVDTQSRFIFTANRDSNSVSGFTIGASGALTAATVPPVTAGTKPLALAGDPSGAFLFVANNTSNTVSSFVILGNGTLSASSTPTANTGTGPVAVVAVP